MRCLSLPQTLSEHKNQRRALLFGLERAVIQMDTADLRIHRSLFGLKKWLISNNGQALDIIHICCQHEN